MFSASIIFYQRLSILLIILNGFSALRYELSYQIISLRYELSYQKHLQYPYLLFLSNYITICTYNSFKHIVIQFSNQITEKVVEL
jgi:hypothetical protein